MKCLVALDFLIARAKLAKKFRRIRAGKHPVYDWGATSKWSKIDAMLRRTINGFVTNEVASLIDNAQKHTQLRRLMSSDRITFGPGPEIEWKVKFNPTRKDSDK